jgi:hypothetical protein
MENILQRDLRRLDVITNETEEWYKIKVYINKLKIGDLLTLNYLKELCGLKPITERGLRQGVEQIREDTLVELYKHYLVKSGIIKFVTYGTYQKVTHIPERITIVDLKNIVADIRRNPWMEWFVPLHKRLGVTEKELYGE